MVNLIFTMEYTQTLSNIHTMSSQLKYNAYHLWHFIVSSMCFLFIHHIFAIINSLPVFCFYSIQHSTKINRFCSRIQSRKMFSLLSNVITLFVWLLQQQPISHRSIIRTSSVPSNKLFWIKFTVIRKITLSFHCLCKQTSYCCVSMARNVQSVTKTRISVKKVFFFLRVKMDF